MNTILVPISSLKEKKATIIYAIDFAKYFGSKIYGIQINAISEDDHLEEIMDYANANDVSINFRPVNGHIIDYVEEFSESFNIDLIIASARTPKTNEKFYLDHLSGSIVRKTVVPVLLIPEHYKFKPYKTVLTAVKSGVVRLKGAMDPLHSIQEKFKTQTTLLQVKTPEFISEDLMFDKDLAAVTSKYYSTENATLFQGLLEYIHVVNPDLICVFRRKRGFFEKLWSTTLNDNSVRKSDFESRLPLLVLKGEQ